MPESNSSIGTGDAVWNLQGVSLGGRDRPRLDNISLEIKPGVTAVLGVSGAGKSSLLNVLAGFEKPSAGTVTFAQQDDSRLPLYWIPQDYGLWAHLTAAEHICCVIPRSAASDRSVSEWLSLFRIEAVAQFRPWQMSLGERSRLSIARALASEAQVLVLDEPLAHVDPVHADKYWQQLKMECDRQTRSVVFSAHEPARVLSLAERVVCLESGRLVWSGPTQDLYSKPPSRELAWLLGPCNWFDSGDEYTFWCGNDRPVRACLRPEEVQLVRSTDSGFPAEAVDFAGALLYATIRCTRTDQMRRVVARTDFSIRVGDHIQIEVLSSAVGGPEDSQIS